jgi:uncharacterized SAM-binding protein YcdF (DUF218 family)
VHFVYVVLGKRLSRKEYLSTDEEVAVHPDALLRVEALAAISRESPIDIAVFTGGTTAGDDLPSEAESMLFHYLGLDHGPVTPRCICERKARSTAENAACVKSALKDVQYLTVHVITNGYHAERARKIFLAAGFNVVVLVAEEVIGMFAPERKAEMEQYKESFHVRFERVREWCILRLPTRLSAWLASWYRN